MGVGLRQLGFEPALVRAEGSGQVLDILRVVEIVTEQHHLTTEGMWDLPDWQATVWPMAEPTIMRAGATERNTS